MIPRIIHQIWLGPRKPPTRLMATWRDMHPEWQHMVWTEGNMPQLKCSRQFEQMDEWAGKADILRYEILEQFGGVYVDADAECIKPMDGWLLERDSFAVFENEEVRPGLVANGYIGTRPHTALMKELIAGIQSKDVGVPATGMMAWQTVGPLYFTRTIMALRYPIDVFPSWMFIPEHYTGLRHPRADEAYCHQLWGSTRESVSPGFYDSLT